MSFAVHMMSFVYPNRQELLDALDTIHSIKNWRAASGAIFIVTEESVASSSLSQQIHKAIPSLQKFIIARIDGTQSQGLSDKETWNFLNNPKPAD